LNVETKKATERRKLAKDEANRLQLTMQAAEIDKQILQQIVQNLTSIVELLRITTVKSVNKFLNRLKLDLNCITNK